MIETEASMIELNLPGTVRNIGIKLIIKSE
jgi:hypothetical protein